MTTEVRTEAASHPVVRNACEECHNRKIRCHVSNDGGSCQACQNNNRLCFFLPRNKSGRPKITSNGTKESRQSPSSAATSTSVAAAVAASAGGMSVMDRGSPGLSRHSTHSSAPYQSPPPHSGRPIPSANGHRPMPSRAVTDGVDLFPNMCGVPPDWQDSSYTQPSPFSMPQMDMEPSFGFPAELPRHHSTGVFDLHRSGSIGHHMHTASESSLESMNHDWNFSSGASTFFPTPATLPGTPIMSPDSRRGSEMCFSNLLAHINRLQQCYEKITTGQFMPYHGSASAQLESLLVNVDASCVATCQTLKAQCQMATAGHGDASMFMQLDGSPAPSGSVDQSTVALAVTTVLKVAEVCEAVISSDILTAQSSLDNMLLFKRLECNILQLRIALANIQKLDQALSYLTEDATKKIGIIQSKFELLKNECE